MSYIPTFAVPTVATPISSGVPIPLQLTSTSIPLQVPSSETILINPETVSPSGEGVSQYTLFSQDSIQNLTECDFDLQTMRLKINKCIAVLFYVENPESHAVARIWSLLAQQRPDILFGSVNLMTNRKINTALNNLKIDPSHPLHVLTTRGYPIILIYRNGWPILAYNGPNTTESISKFLLQSPCSESEIQFKMPLVAQSVPVSPVIRENPVVQVQTIQVPVVQAPVVQAPVVQAPMIQAIPITEGMFLPTLGTQ